MKLKRFFAALLAGLALTALAGCEVASSKPSSQAEPKDYAKVIHDARSEEDNAYYMIFSQKDGKYTAQDGYSGEYDESQLSDEVENMLMPLLNLEEGMYTDFAASLSSMMVQSYGIAIVKPADGKTQEVVEALKAYILSEQQSTEHYLEDQYQIAKNAK